MRKIAPYLALKIMLILVFNTTLFLASFFSFKLF
jgi:hypothetical protein